MFPKAPPVEVRNQARVHLWYRGHFGHDYPASTKSTDGIARFASKTHAVGVRLNPDDQFELYAPFGLDDIFSFVLTPNLALPNSGTHTAKAQCLVKIWPELTVVPWPETS